MMIIRRATIEDLTSTLNLVKKVIVWMESIGLRQWNDEYPSRKVEGDIGKGTLHVAEDGEGLIRAMICLDQNQSPEYDDVNWEAYDTPIYVIHRLSVDPDIHAQGLGRKMMVYVETLAKSEGGKSIRLDAYSMNSRAQEFYKSRGYKFKGEVHFERLSEPFNCYELSL